MNPRHSALWLIVAHPPPRVFIVTVRASREWRSWDKTARSELFTRIHLVRQTHRHRTRNSITLCFRIRKILGRWIYKSSQPHTLRDCSIPSFFNSTVTAFPKWRCWLKLRVSDYLQGVIHLTCRHKPNSITLNEACTLTFTSITEMNLQQTSSSQPDTLRDCSIPFSFSFRCSRNFSKVTMLG